jgi:hypothetical protein
MCPLTGHHGSIVTRDGRIWNILEGEKSQDLIHNSSLLGRRVRIEGRIYRKAGSLAVSGYQFALKHPLLSSETAIISR